MVKLKDLRPGEKISFVIRRHWIIFVLLGLYLFGAIFISSILFVLFGFTIFISLLIIVFWMFFALFLYIERLNHELDMFVITNNRIIFIEQKSFLNRSKTECNLGQVQEVNSTTKGLIANLLDYGVLTITTAGSTSNLEMTFVPQASEKARQVLNIVDEYRDINEQRDKVKKEIKN